MIKLNEVWEQVTKLPMPDETLSPEEFNKFLKLDKDHRHGIIFAMGLKWNDEEFFYKDLNYHWTDILIADDEKFFKICKEIEWYFNREADGK